MLLVAVCVCTPATLTAQPAHNNAATQSYGIWSAMWWQWALNKTVSTSPQLGPTASNPARLYCESSGINSVWFLGGTFGNEGPLLRQCTVPAGARLFFPVANAFYVRDFPTPDWPLKLSKELAGTAVDQATELKAVIDGVPVSALLANRVASPAFQIKLPQDNIFGVPAGIFTPAVSDGIWLMLPPLSPGMHTIYFHATFPTGELIDLTYTINAVL